MMISKKMETKLNAQIKEEYNSEWIYRSMAYALEGMNLSVFGQWFHKQADEEASHAQKIAKYVLNQGGAVKLGELPAPKSDWKSVEEICETAVKHEIHITECINKLWDEAHKESDKATLSMLNWFVDEQVEEVATTTQLLEMVKLAKTPGQIMMLEGRVWRMVQERS
ncbi:MAG: ferritin [bacterium]